MGRNINETELLEYAFDLIRFMSVGQENIKEAFDDPYILDTIKRIMTEQPDIKVQKEAMLVLDVLATM